MSLYQRIGKTPNKRHIVFRQSKPILYQEKFLNKFGICMQVVRKSGNVWLENTSTDDWTLEQQNEEGKSLAQHFKIERENPDDHDMY